MRIAESFKKLVSPTFLKWTHLFLTIAFLIQIPFALLTSWKDSVPYLVFLSLWALVASHFTGWQGARVEVSVEQDIDVDVDIDVERKETDGRNQA